MIYDGGNDLGDLKEKVDEAVAYLRRHKDKFDFIAVRGCSGMIVGAPAALRLKKPLVVVRKPNENSHAFMAEDKQFVNARNARGRYVFLDDFVSSGETRGKVQDALDGRAIYAGTYCYSRKSDVHWVSADELADAA